MKTKTSYYMKSVYFGCDMYEFKVETFEKKLIFAEVYNVEIIDHGDPFCWKYIIKDTENNIIMDIKCHPDDYTFNFEREEHMIKTQNSYYLRRLEEKKVINRNLILNKLEEQNQ